MVISALDKWSQANGPCALRSVLVLVYSAPTVGAIRISLLAQLAEHLTL